MATLLYQGHASVRIVTDSGFVTYIDPSIGDGYSLPADLVLITHEHGDHNKLDLVPQKAGCRVIRAADALAGGYYQRFREGEADVQAVPAGNSNHDPKRCVGYILRVDGVSLYHAGDTSSMPQMLTMPGLGLDWALLPTDGVYNMGAKEAARCARAIGARHTIPIHTDPSYRYNREVAVQLDVPGRVLLEPGQEIRL